MDSHLPDESHAIELAGRAYLLVTLGCFRNEVDSDLVRSTLGALGMVETSRLTEAQAILVMTCGFIKEACDEGIDTILELCDLATDAKDSPPVLVLGCMGERYGGALLEEMPELAAVLGCGWRDEISAALSSALGGHRYVGDPGKAATLDVRRTANSSQGATLFLRVADGCDRGCGFCTIPSIKGPFSSRAPSDIVEELERLAAGREREVILLAQDLTSYGCDIADGDDLASLIGRITRVTDVHWLRLLYLQPEGVTERLIEEVASNDAVCKYFDVPFQHASATVLRRMGRNGSAEQHLALIDRIRSAVPDAAVRSTVMVGYPGESEREFDELLEFVKAARFDWLGAFVFSPEEGTRAAELEGAISTETAVSRYNTVVEAQDYIEAASLGSMYGRELEVVVDELCETEPYDLVGRSYREAPVVDGTIYLKRATARGMRAMPGQFTVARITGHEGLDLVGEI